MKLRFCLLLTAVVVLAAADYFSEPYACLQDAELPRTVENISGEWFLRKFHAINVDRETDDAWEQDFPTQEHEIYRTTLFDEGGCGCLDLKHEGRRIVYVSYYRWKLLDDGTLVRSDERNVEEYRIETLTYLRLVLVTRRKNYGGQTCEITYYYDRYFQ